MAGLLDRALRFRERTQVPDGAEGVSGEERERILADIDALFLAKGSRAARPAVRKRRRGLALPIAVNAAGLLLAAAFFAFLGVRRNRGYAGVERRSSVGLEAESGLIERVRSQAGAELSARDRRIAEIRAELERLRLASAGPAPSRSAGVAGVTGAPGTAAPAAPSPAALGQPDRLDLERSLRAELATLEGESARRLSELEKSRTEAAFLLGELRGVYGEARRLAASGDAAAAREKTETAERILAKVEGSQAGSPDLDALLREGNEALTVALRAAETAPQPSASAAALSAPGVSAAELEAARTERDDARAERDAALNAASAARTAEARARADASKLSAKVADAQAELEGTRRLLSERDAKASARLERTERIAAALESGISADRSRLPQAKAPSQEELLALIDAKLKLKELAGAGASARGEPGLYEDFERSLDELAAAERNAGALEALRGVASAIGKLESSVAEGQARPEKASPEAAADDYLARLDALLSGLIESLR